MLDQMAAEGAQLRNHYCPAPVCAPSRSSLLTGVHQGHAVVRDNQFDKALEDNHTLGTVMQSAGYRTALIGKYGLQGQGEDSQSWDAYPTKRGFDEFFGYVRHVDGHVHYPADHWPLGNSEKHRTPKQLWHNDREISADLSKCYTTDLFTAKAKHSIAEHANARSEQPFFMYLAFDTPHAALQVPTVAFPKGQGLDGGLQWTGKPGSMINTAFGEIDSYRHPDYTGKGWTDVEERFATMVRRIDNCVGDLLATLNDLGIANNTLVVLSSDNGPHKESYLDKVEYAPTSFESFGPFSGIKRDVWEGGIRMPTLAWWPGTIEPGSIDRSSSQFHDWLPTFADIGGQLAPERTDGVSLLNRLKGRSVADGATPDSQIYIEYFQSGSTPKYSNFPAEKQGTRRRQMQVVHVDGFKGVRFDIKKHSDPFMIYDLQEDPTELRDLAGQGAKFTKLQAKMHDRVLQLRRPNVSAKRPYDDEPVPSVNRGGEGKSMTMKFYGGDFDFVPKTTGMSATEVSKVSDFTSRSDRSGLVQWEGFIEVPRTGQYTFSLATDQKAFVRIHNIALIDADYGYQTNTRIDESIRLAKGSHPIRVSLLAGEGGAANLDFSWSSAQR